MSRMNRLARWLTLGTLGGMLWTAGCLPENFWAGKWGEIVNRSIFGVINGVVGAATNGAVQL